MILLSCCLASVFEFASSLAELDGVYQCHSTGISTQSQLNADSFRVFLDDRARVALLVLVEVRKSARPFFR